MADDEWFRSLSGEPSLWKWQAKGLIQSADVLRAEYTQHWTVAGTPPINGSDEEIRLWFVQRSAVLLYGIAIENLLKGLRVVRLKEAGRQPVQITKWKGLQLQLGGHDLEELANAAKIDLTSQEQFLLRDVSEVVLWSGRYHLPLRSNDFAPIVDRSDKATAARAFAHKLIALYPPEPD